MKYFKHTENNEAENLDTTEMRQLINLVFPSLLQFYLLKET